MNRSKDMTRPIRKLLVALVAAGVLSMPGSASALDRNDILQLQAAGLGPDVIVSVIRSSPEPLTVTPEEVEELRIAGVPQPVLDEICLRVGCGAAAPGPIGPAPGPGPDLQQELERQRQLEEQRRQLETERMEQERQRMREAIEAEQAREQSVQTAYQGLEIADRYYRSGEYVRAASVYQEFIDEVAPAPGTVELYEAQAGFVRSMYGAGYRHVIRSETLQVALAGPTSRHFEEVVGMLIDISNEASYLDPQFERLTEFTVGQYSEEFQDEWNYFLGRFFWIYGEFLRSQEYLARVRGVSPRAGQAQYLTGVMALEQGENRRAVGAFEHAITATERNDSDAEVAELAFLALARILYQIGDNDAALFYYYKIPAESHRHPRARFEMAWTYLLKTDWNRAIGALHSLHSPYYSQYFYPELYVMEAAIYLQTCNLDSAGDAILAFDEAIEHIQGPVREFTINTGSPQEYWTAISTYYDVLGTPNEVALPVEAVRAVLSDIDFVNQMELIEQLETESDLLARHAESLGDFATQRVAGLNADVQTRIIDAGLKISAIITDFEMELTDWYVKAQEVGIEISAERIQMIEVSLSGADVGGEASTSVFVLAQDWQYWPFEGEYWLDEIDNYRGDLPQLRDDRTGACMAVREIPEEEQ